MLSKFSPVNALYFMLVSMILLRKWLIHFAVSMLLSNVQSAYH